MNKSLFTLCLTFLICTNQATLTSSNDPTKLFLGAIEFCKPLTYDLCLYYKGKKISPEWDKQDTSAQFSFLESKYTQELYVLICESISCKTTENNTVKHLVNPCKNYKCYKLNAQRSEDEQGNAVCTWNLELHELDMTIIPDNTLIFLFNPDFIEGLKVHSWKTDNTMRLMPTIQIKQSVSNKELMRAMTVTRLTAIDVDALHTKTTSLQSASC